MWNYGELEKFIFITGAILGAVVLIELLVSRFLSEKPLGFHLPVLLGFFLLGLFGTVAATSSPAVKILLALLSAVLVYFQSATAYQSVREVFTIATAFLVSLSIWAWNFYFTAPWWSLTLLAFGSYLVIFWACEASFSQADSFQTIWPILAGLLMVEVFWAMLYLPLHYLTMALVTTTVFYALYEFFNLHIRGRLNRMQILFHSVFIIVILMASLLSTAWQPIH